MPSEGTDWWPGSCRPRIRLLVRHRRHTERSARRAVNPGAVDAHGHTSSVLHHSSPSGFVECIGGIALRRAHGAARRSRPSGRAALAPGQLGFWRTPASIGWCSRSAQSPGSRIPRQRWVRHTCGARLGRDGAPTTSGCHTSSTSANFKVLSGPSLPVALRRTLGRPVLEKSAKDTCGV